MRKFLLLLLVMPLTIVAVDAQVPQKTNPDCPELRYDAHLLPKLRTIDIPGFTVELLNISKVAIVVRRDRLSSSFQIERFSFSERTWTTVVHINEQPGTGENGAVKPSAGEQNQEILNSFVLLKPGDTYSQRIQVGERLSHEQARSLGPGRYRISFYYSDDGHASAPAGRIECTPTATKEFVVRN